MHELAGVLRHVESESGGDIRVISIGSGLLFDEEIDLMAHVRVRTVGSREGCDAYLVVHSGSVEALQQTIEGLQQRQRESGDAGIAVQGLLLAEELPVDAREAVKEAGLSWVEFSMGKVQLRLPRFHFSMLFEAGPVEEPVHSCRAARRADSTAKTELACPLEDMVNATKHESNLVALLDVLLHKHPKRADGWTNVELAEKLDIRPSATHKFKDRLLANGILESSEKAKTRFRLSAKGREELEAKLAGFKAEYEKNHPSHARKDL